VRIGLEQDAGLSGQLGLDLVQVFPDYTVNGSTVNQSVSHCQNRLVVCTRIDCFAEKSFRTLPFSGKKILGNQLAGVGERVAKGEDLSSEVVQSPGRAVPGHDDVGVVYRTPVSLGNCQKLQTELAVAVDIWAAADNCPINLAGFELTVDLLVTSRIYILDLAAKFSADVIEEFTVEGKSLPGRYHSPYSDPDRAGLPAPFMVDGLGFREIDFFRLIPVAPWKGHDEDGGHCDEETTLAHDDYSRSGYAV